MDTKSVLCALAIGAASCIVALPAKAQAPVRSAAVDESVRHYQRATEASNAQNWELALTEYDASNRASPSIAAQAGIADAHYHLHHDTEATDAYTRLLATNVELPADQPALRAQWEAQQQTARTRIAEMNARKSGTATASATATPTAKKPPKKKRRKQEDDDDNGDEDRSDDDGPHADGGRFRFGINPTIGLETVSAGGASVSGAMYGLDLRLGWQINHLLAVYAQPHLSFGSVGTSTAGGRVSGATGTIVGTVIAEVTLIDRLFIGAGAGYGVLNNPSGPTIEGRFGAYPLMGRGSNGIRRRGLMIGGDIRAIFADGYTGTLIMGCIGYEAF